MKTLQQVIDERHERENALFRGRSKAAKCGLKIQKDLYEKERIRKFTAWAVIGTIFIVGVLILAHLETKEAIEKCLTKHSQDYCEQTLGAR